MVPFFGNIVNLLFVKKIRIIQLLRYVVKSNVDTFYIISLSEKNDVL